MAKQNKDSKRGKANTTKTFRNTVRKRAARDPEFREAPNRHGDVDFERCPMALKRKAKVWIASCPGLDIHSQGATKGEAKKNLGEAIRLFIETCSGRGTLAEAIKNPDPINLCVSCHLAEKLKNPEFKKAYENEKVIADKKVAKATKKQSHAMAVPSETAIGLHKIELIDNVTLFNSANPTAGEILLEEFLKPMGITQAQLAKATFISQKRLREFIAGKRAFDADIGLRLSRYFSMSDGFFERLQLEHDLSEARGEIAETLSKIKPLRYKKHDVTLEKLAGTWSEQDAAEFQENIEALENITSVSREGYCFNPNSQIGPIQFDAEGAKALFELMENPPEPSPALKKVIAGVNKRHKAGRRLKEQEKRRFFELADRLGASTDTKEQQELKEQLARMTFGADDPIVQEVRKAGEELAKKSNYSLRDMFKRLRNNEKKSKVTKGTKKV